MHEDDKQTLIKLGAAEARFGHALDKELWLRFASIISALVCFPVWWRSGGYGGPEIEHFPSTMIFVAPFALGLWWWQAKDELDIARNRLDYARSNARMAEKHPK